MVRMQFKRFWQFFFAHAQNAVISVSGPKSKVKVIRWRHTELDTQRLVLTV